MVIGNPPYIDSEMMVNIGLNEHRIFINETYQFISGNWDIYMAFFEKGLSLSCYVLCYITPDKWLSKPFGLKFREKCMLPRMSEVLHVGSDIFENVRVDGIISLFLAKSNTLKTLKFDNKKDVCKISFINKTEIEPPYLIDYLFSTNSIIISKIEKSVANKLIDVAVCEGSCATKDAYDLIPFLENNAKYKKTDYFALVNTGTIDKYSNKWGIKEITYLGNKLLYPIVNKKKFNANFGRTYVAKAAKPKIIFKGLNLLDAFIDIEGTFLPGKSTLVICSDDIELLKYLCGIINSKLAIFFIKNKYSSSSYCGGITFTKEMFNCFPLSLAPQHQKSIINLINKIIFLKNKNPVADTSTLERKIDNLVYRYYNLTYDEVKIIEPDFPLSKAEYEEINI